MRQLPPRSSSVHELASAHACQAWCRAVAEEASAISAVAAGSVADVDAAVAAAIAAAAAAAAAGSAGAVVPSASVVPLVAHGMAPAATA